jgi:hypothetical protein
MGCSFCKFATATVVSGGARELCLSADFLENLKSKAAASATVVYVEVVRITNLPETLNLSGLSGPFIEAKLVRPDPIASEQLQRSAYKPYTKVVTYVRMTRFELFLC